MDRVDVAAPVLANEMLFRFTTGNPDHAIGQADAVYGNRIDIRAGIAASYQPDDPSTDDIDESVNAGWALFAIPTNNPRLTSDLARGANASR